MHYCIISSLILTGSNCCLAVWSLFCWYQLQTVPVSEYSHWYGRTRLISVGPWVLRRWTPFLCSSQGHLHRAMKLYSVTVCSWSANLPREDASAKLTSLRMWIDLCEIWTALCLLPCEKIGLAHASCTYTVCSLLQICHQKWPVWWCQLVNNRSASQIFSMFDFVVQVQCKG